LSAATRYLSTRSPAPRKISTYLSSRTQPTRKQPTRRCSPGHHFAGPGGREPRAVDILPAIDGVEFDAAWERRVQGVTDPESGLTAFFISAADIVTAKIAAGTPQDLADVAALRKAAESQP
jgi:hypothetical protein